MGLSFRSLPFALGRRPPAKTAQVPAGQRIYAIGDVHGRLDLLDELLAMIDADNARRQPVETQLIFLGDLIDRGPDSCGVIERALELSASGRDVRFLKGNHEEMLLAALASDRSEPMRFFLRNGGEETLLSYPISPQEFDEGSLIEIRDLARQRIPEAHLDFLSGMEDMIASGDYLFVHAGIRPGVPVEEQKSEDLRWIRAQFLESRRDHGAIVVHGHTITENVEERSNRIGIDTGAYASGRLTAVGLEGGDRWYLATSGD